MKKGRTIVSWMRAMIRLVFYKICNYKVVFCKRVFRLVGTRIELDRNSEMIIGDLCIMNDFSRIIVRGGGTLKLGNRVSLGIRTIINCHSSIEIGDNVNIAPDVKIYDHDHDFKNYSLSGVKWRENFLTSSIRIGSNVWIGANTVILRGAQIGDNTVIGAGCIIKGNYRGNCVITQKRDVSVTDLE